MPGDQAAVVHEFATWVRAEAQISINLRLFVVVEFLDGGCYQTAYEWAAEQSRLSGRSSKDVLRERFGGFHDRRVAFDRAFRDGEQFRYGALNAGGLGLPKYGSYCAVLSREWQDSLVDAACLPGDSLTICSAADGSFDPAAVGILAAPHTHRHMMVAKERAGQVPATGKPEWPRLVASPGGYFGSFSPAPSLSLP
jgi:hypothetical protein